MSSNASASSVKAQHNNKRQRTDEMKASAKTDSCTNETKQSVTPDGPIEDEPTARENIVAVGYDPDNVSEITFMKTMKRK